MDGKEDRFGRGIVDCAGIALTSRRRVFLIMPFYGGNAQAFAIPKGHVNGGESLHDAAKREFFEETGIDIGRRRARRLATVYTRNGTDGVKRVTVFEVRGDGTERFDSARIRGEAMPETIYGEYVPFDVARRLITWYQIPVVDRLMEDDTSSLVNFYNKRTRL